MLPSCAAKLGGLGPDVFHSLYIGFLGGDIVGAGGSGATYPIDMTSPRWLLCMPGIDIVLACGWLCIGVGTVSIGGGSSGSGCEVEEEWDPVLVVRVLESPLGVGGASDSGVSLPRLFSTAARTSA